MKSNYDTELDILLGKYLSGEASPEEAMTIDDWLNEPGNKEQFNEIVKVWNAGKESAPYYTPLLTSAWTELKERLSRKKSVGKHRVFKNSYAIAAGFIAIIICGVIVFLMQRKGSSFLAKEYVKLRSVSDPLWDTLPDGSTIVMNRKSTINYEKTFNKNERQLSLIGEAYFTVMPNKISPFIITIDELKIKVIGTAFNVRKQDHPRSVEVQVQSGIVKMYTDKKELTVNKGQTGIYSNNGQFTINDGIDNNSMSYATRNFLFNDMPLSEIVKSIEKAFAVIIIPDKERILQCRMTAGFQNESLTYIMDVIAVTLNINYSIQGNKIYLKGHGCN